MGKCFSCFKSKIKPIVYKKQKFIMYNTEITHDKYRITSEKTNIIVHRKIQSCDNINLLGDSISPLSRHSNSSGVRLGPHRKAKSMDCLFSLV